MIPLGIPSLFRPVNAGISWGACDLFSALNMDVPLELVRALNKLSAIVQLLRLYCTRLTLTLDTNPKRQRGRALDSAMRYESDLAHASG
jgi:hypothetical protein